MTKQQQIEFRKNMANRMRKFTGVTDKYDPNANMKKFMGQKSWAKNSGSKFLGKNSWVKTPGTKNPMSQISCK